jgi:hypothetical protein
MNNCHVPEHCSFPVVSTVIYTVLQYPVQQTILICIRRSLLEEYSEYDVLVLEYIVLLTNSQCLYSTRVPGTVYWSYSEYEAGRGVLRSFVLEYNRTV